MTNQPSDDTALDSSSPVEGTPPGEQPRGEGSGPTLVEDELLVEEISIDGMCGVY